MQIIASHYGQRLSSYTLRWAHMITKSAKKRARILAFWEKHGLEATKEAFAVKQSTLYDWRKRLDLFPFKKPLAHTASNFRFPFTVNMPGGNSRYRR